MDRIYFDNAATTPLDPAVAAAMAHAMQHLYGNPSSIHAEGRSARTAIEQARKAIAQRLNASIGEIFFTSGGTEANNMVLKCAVRDLGVRRILSAATEHHCVLHSLDALRRQYPDLSVVLLPTDAFGHVDLQQLDDHLSAGSAVPTLVSLMHANNEIGTLLDLQRVAAICQAHGALFHSDTVQTLGFYPIDVAAAPIHFLSGSAHKFHGPKGVGFVYINGDNRIYPFVDGGAQERNMRGGTENTYGIIGMAKALELAYAELPARSAHIRQLRQHLLDGLRDALPDVDFNGDVPDGHYKILNLRFAPSDKTDLLLFNLDIAGISVSGGSACSSGTDTGSHVIRALRGDTDDAVNIRVSFSHLNTVDEVSRLIAVITGVFNR
jgi:cysteine desulfurase